jgi:hypothetical protein
MYHSAVRNEMGTALEAEMVTVRLVRYKPPGTDKIPGGIFIP